MDSLIKKQLKLFDSDAFIAERESEDPAMIQHLDILKKINKHGYLTTNSQAGKKTGNDMEKAYITGVMLAEDAALFIKNMSVHTDKIVAEVVISEQDTLPIPVTISKNKKIDVHTHLRFSMFKSEAAHEFKTLGITGSDRNKFVFVTCCDPVWGRVELFDAVLEMLKIKKDTYVTPKDKLKDQLKIVSDLLKKNPSDSDLQERKKELELRVHDYKEMNLLADRIFLF